jgi:hypothetical protein
MHGHMNVKKSDLSAFFKAMNVIFIPCTFSFKPKLGVKYEFIFKDITEILKYMMWGILFVCFCRESPQWFRASSFTSFLDHTQRRTTVGRTPLDEWSARRTDLYLTTHNTHNRQTDIHAPGGSLTHNLSRRAATDPRLRPRGHWDWQRIQYFSQYFKNWATFMILCIAFKGNATKREIILSKFNSVRIFFRDGEFWTWREENLSCVNIYFHVLWMVPVIMLWTYAISRNGQAGIKVIG